jgi:chromosome partitioning protein
MAVPLDVVPPSMRLQDRMPVPPIPALPADYSTELYSPQVRMISLFNNKGGVAKTTSVYTLGWALAAKGYHVIMFDFDTQRNLSQMVLRGRIRKHGDTWASYIARLPQPCLIGQAIRTSLDYSAAATPMYTDAVATFPQWGGELRLAIGDVDLCDMDNQIPTAEAMMPMMPAVANVPGAPYHLALRTAAAYGATICLFDLSPSISPLNRTLLCSSHNFIVPCAGEYFTKEAVESLASWLVGPGTRTFLAKAAAVRSCQAAVAAQGSTVHFPFPDITPTFLGTLMTRFNVKTLVGEVLPVAVQTGIDQVHAAVRTTLVPRLRDVTPASRGEPGGVGNVDLTLPDAHFEAAGISVNTYNLMMLRDYYSLNPISQYLAVPAPFLTQAMGKALQKWSVSPAHLAAIMALQGGAGGGDGDVEMTGPVFGGDVTAAAGGVGAPAAGGAGAPAVTVPAGVAPAVMVDADSLVTYTWVEDMAERVASFRVTVGELVYRVLDLLMEPMAIRTRALSSAELAPIFVGGAIVDPMLVFTEF